MLGPFRAGCWHWRLGWLRTRTLLEDAYIVDQHRLGREWIGWVDRAEIFANLDIVVEDELPAAVECTIDILLASDLRQWFGIRPGEDVAIVGRAHMVAIYLDGLVVYKVLDRRTIILNCPGVPLVGKRAWPRTSIVLATVREGARPPASLPFGIGTVVVARHMGGRPRVIWCG